ncbi:MULTISPECIES: ClC family H(+)/Cl(-) exchange transporter [unclassified Paenibacillus]|uniref:ClC family H(+)/Cl(-) exchange transporter n=1 Tax=unclassified Paenibacillus TaxID=185978 RepID=UPI001F2AFF4C|nr:ClC family H(+)/Cl(-) exchange transporter [Paenibacillus sp. MZ03-122A]MCF2719645.1 ClC family H(+)/Cl(-) exchange transporter [Paenibacillus sp. UKAQ_18]MCP3779143.1 ClC family H(+)/Cl(-) exchange transporter [Paenibacillus sp. MZ03-122A]
MERNDTQKTLATWFNFKFRLLIGGIVVGLLSGSVVVLFRFVLEEALERVLEFYHYQLRHMWIVPLWFVILVIVGWATGMTVKKQPAISGSGIPQVKAVLQNKLHMNWWKALTAKFLGGAISIGSGLSLGREGPSIQIGALTAQGFSRLMSKSKTEENILITCGASAGLAAAFNAPIAGVIFALEEIHLNFSPLILIASLASSLVADFVSKEFFGMSPVFHFMNVGPVPLNQYVHLLILGIIVGIMGVIFNKSIYAFQDFYQKMTWLPAPYRPILPFVISGVLGLSMPLLLGGGNGLVNDLITDSFSLKFLLVILILKFLFTMFSYGSSAPGGIFLPMLVIGALIGVMYSKFINGLWGMPVLSESSFLILAMAGYLTASLKAPITGIILITEMTGNFTNLLSTGVVCLVAYMTAELFRSHPVYEVLLERFLHQRKASGETEQSSSKVILEVPILQGSRLDGTQIKDFQWPAHCLIVSVKRGSVEKIPDGQMLLLAGDYLNILTSGRHAAYVHDCLREPAGQSTDWIKGIPNEKP